MTEHILQNQEKEKNEMRCARCGEPMPETEEKTGFSFMRHGRTQMNEDNIAVGSIDEPMNETGRRQAEAAAERFKQAGVIFDCIVSSPMSRAIETARIIGTALRINTETDNRLRERNVGVIQGQPETPESENQLLKYDYKPEGAEPLEQFEEETKEFLRDIEEKYRGKRALFVTHGFRMLTLVKLIHGWDIEKIMTYEPPKNCEEIEFEVSDSCPRCGNKFFELNPA